MRLLNGAIPANMGVNHREASNMSHFKHTGDGAKYGMAEVGRE